jgi:hypothetical protein
VLKLLPAVWYKDVKPCSTYTIHGAYSTEFAENLTFHSGEYVFHKAEHINGKDRCNNRKLSCTVPENCKLFWSGRTYNSFQAYQAKFRTLFFCDSALHHTTPTIFCAVSESGTSLPVAEPVMCLIFLPCYSWKLLHNTETFCGQVCISFVNISIYLTRKLIFRGKIIVSEISM